MWLSEIMLQQTTVAAVGRYYAAFTARWPTVQDLATAGDAEVMAAWAGLGYYARARNLLKCARVVAGEYGGKFPETREALLNLPGIGPYTAGAIGAIAFGRCEVVVDGNVERVMARLFAVTDPLPGIKPDLVRRAAEQTPALRAGDYAQAVMDLGATICTPRNPACGLCPLGSHCGARDRGIQNTLPARSRKAVKPTRRGIVYVGRRGDGAWLLERRPDKGLLGGMLGWPGGDWAEVAIAAPPANADWTTLAGEVRHTFTHFHLILEISVATLPMESRPETGAFWGANEFDKAALPTVMRKAYDLAAGHFGI